MGDQRMFHYQPFLPKAPSNRLLDPHTLAMSSMRYEFDQNLCYRNNMNNRNFCPPFGYTPIVYHLPLPVRDLSSTTHITSPVEYSYNAVSVSNYTPVISTEYRQENVPTKVRTPLVVLDRDTRLPVDLENVSKVNSPVNRKPVTLIPLFDEAEKNLDVETGNLSKLSAPRFEKKIPLDDEIENNTVVEVEGMSKVNELRNDKSCLIPDEIGKDCTIIENVSKVNTSNDQVPVTLVPSVNEMQRDDELELTETRGGENKFDADIQDIISEDDMKVNNYVDNVKVDLFEVESTGTDVELVEGRIIYFRESLLALKCASSKIDLKHYETIMKQIGGGRKSYMLPHGNYVQRRIIRLPATALVKTVANAFIPTKLRTSNEDESANSLTSFLKQINIILNRLADDNFEETLVDLRKINITNADQLKELAKSVFQKSIRQPKICKVFANLCKELKSLSVNGSENFSVFILESVKEMFNKPLESLVAEVNKKIDDKITAAKDDSIKKMLEEDRETNILKQRDFYFGNITFMAELFLCKCISLKTISDCLKKLKDSTSSESLNSITILLNLCGSELEQSSKPLLSACFARLEQAKNSDDIEVHEAYKLRELIELRARGWKLLENQSQVTDGTSRRIENKQRQTTSIDPKRKSISVVNQIKPSSLAVTQQSHDSRKLGPTYDNWGQGSGQLYKSDDNNPKSNTIKFPANNRSRESSTVPSGPQGAWLNPLPDIQILKREKDYPTMLENTSPTGRVVIDMLGGNERVYDDVFLKIAEDERCALLHNVYEILMDKSSKLRIVFSEVCVDLLNKNILKPRDMISSFLNFFEFCDSDWLSDYPQGWVYIAEILSYLIRNTNYFSLLLKIVEPLRCDGRASLVIAHCLRLNIPHLEQNQITQVLKESQFGWTKMGISEQNIKSFLVKHSLEFTMNFNHNDSQNVVLNELNDLIHGNSISECGMNNFFRRLSSQGNVSDLLIQSVMQVIMQSPNLNRAKIDSIVIPLGILIDHIPTREYQVLCSLQNSSFNPAMVESWLLSLIEKKVISSEAINFWKNKGKKCNRFHKMNEIMSKNPVLNNL